MTLFAYTDRTHPYPQYVNVGRDTADRLRIIARAPSVNGREGPTATVTLDPAEAIALARAILLEYAP